MFVIGKDGGYGFRTTTNNGVYKNTFCVSINGKGYNFLYSDNESKSNAIYALSGSYNKKEVVLFENLNKYKVNDEGTIGKTNGYTIMAIGANPKIKSVDADFFNGTIYAVRIYDRALTDEEVEHNYYLDQIRFNVGADEDGYVHYTPEELTKLGFSNADQEAYINWETRQVKMYYNGEEYKSENNTTITNVDTTANTNFDMKIIFENNRYKVKVAPEENKAGLEVAYKKASSNTWLHADGYSFEYAEFETTDVKLYDNKGNETIKTIKKLDYLESNQGDYINTEYYASNKTKVETKFSIHAESSSAVFGARQNVNQENMKAYMLVDAASSNKYLYSYYGTAIKWINNEFEEDKIYTATMEKGICEIEDLGSAGTETNMEFSMEIPMYLFAFNEGGRSDYKQAGTRIYYFKIYEDEKIVMDLIPMAIIDSNGVMQNYLFDKVSSKLFRYENT